MYLIGQLGANRSYSRETALPRQNSAVSSLYDRGRRGLLQGRDQSMFQKKAGGIGQIQIIRDTLKVAVKFVLLYRNVLDQNCLASHIYRDLSYFPLVGCDLGSLQGELTALLQASQKATGEPDVVHEHTVD